MKRIPQSAALKTILYYIGGLQKIKVIDYENRYEASIKGNHIVIFEGLYKDANYDTFNYKQERAEITSIEPNGDELIIGICTKNDRY